MVLPLSLLIGLRFSHGCRRNNTVLLIYLISIISITLGVAVMIVSLSVMNGFERELNNRILAVVPHGEIESVNQPWSNWNEALVKIKKVPGISESAPYIKFTGLVGNGVNLQAVQIKGVSIRQEAHLSALPKFVQNNTWINLRAGKQQIIIGKGIADALKIRQNDWVSLMFSNVSTNNKLRQPKLIRLHVIGIFQLNGQIDHSLAIIPLSDAQQYLDIGDSVNGIAIKVNDVFSANKLVHDAGKVTNRNVYIRSWIDIYGYMYHDIQTIRAIIYLTMILVISVACFNIVSTLIMAIEEKVSDIAVLRTLGARDNLIRSIFIWYGLLVGMFGNFFGIVTGIALSLRFTSIINEIENFIGYQFLSGNIYFVDFLPIELQWLDIVYVLIIVFLFSVLASWYPARRACLINPVSILSSH